MGGLKIIGPRNIHRIKEFMQYPHHKAQELVWVRADLKGQHRDFCLCQVPCKHFKPGKPINCPRAQELYEYCVRLNMVAPVWECPEFEPGE